LEKVSQRIFQRKKQVESKLLQTRLINIPIPTNENGVYPEMSGDEEERKAVKGLVVLVPEVHQIPNPRVPVPKPVRDKVFYENIYDLSKQDCEFLYRQMPWIKDVVNQIYISPVRKTIAEGSAPVYGEFSDIVDYDKSITDNNRVYYHPKDKYYNIQCQSTKVQNGDELTIVKNGETFVLIVAVDTKSKGIVIQNEDMLKAEIDYVKIWNANKDDQIKDLKKHEPSDEMVFLAKHELCYAFQAAISQKSSETSIPVVYRSPQSQFISTVVETIRKNSKNGDVFTRLLANIVVFLKIDVSFVSSSSFIKKLQKEIYLPGTLPFMTDSDKLPEIFLSKNVPESTKEFVLKKLEEERAKFTKLFYENLYIGNSIVRKATRPTLWNKPIQQIELPDLKSICKNREHVANESDDDIVFYSEEDDVYCFNIYELYNLFQNTPNAVNPFTQTPFSPEFTQVFLTRYASKPLINKINVVRTTDVEISQLEAMIEAELTFLENKLIIDEHPDMVIGPRLPLNRGNLNPVPQKRRIAHTPAVLREDYSIAEVKKSVKCLECKKDIENFDASVKSIFKNAEVSFCDYECMEKTKKFK
jgi:antitoxin (DNA-binding transcriptional repressor) of toxin-antitoxin stability system